mmetsp:Transcript_32441/g.75683  ORF Transcript_32441/g.75683 Transcript_32441/m.75683 type:complete len:210 (-) Transcript_32441:237-866(-)
MITEPSSRHCLRASGRCTLTAISRPSCISPRYTCPSEAEAMQSVVRDLNSVGPSGSQLLVTGRPGAIGPTALNSSAMTAYASSFGNGLFEVCKVFSAMHTSSGRMSGLWLNVCPTLTASGPSAASSSRSTSPRSMLLVETFMLHAAFTRRKAVRKSSVRATMSAGRFWKYVMMASRSYVAMPGRPTTASSSCCGSAVIETRLCSMFFIS